MNQINMIAHTLRSLECRVYHFWHRDGLFYRSLHLHLFNLSFNLEMCKRKTIKTDNLWTEVKEFRGCSELTASTGASDAGSTDGLSKYPQA